MLRTIGCESARALRKRWKGSVVVCSLVMWACTDSAGPAGAVLGHPAIVPSFSAWSPAVDVRSIAVSLTRLDGSEAARDSVGVPAEATEIEVPLEVRLSGPSEAFDLSVVLWDEAGEVLYRLEPNPQRITVSTSIEAIPIEVEVAYVGLGNEAEALAITPANTAVLAGEAVELIVEAQDALGNPVTGMPVEWLVIDSLVTIQQAGLTTPSMADVLAGAEPGTARVEVRDAKGNADTATVVVEQLGAGLAYMTNDQGNSVSVLDLATNTAVTTIPVGQNPRGIAITPNGAYAYVANFTTNDVSVIDLATNSVTATIPVGIDQNTLTQFAPVAITPDGAYAYVGTRDLSVIDISTNEVTTTIPLPESFADPNGIAITPDGTTAYVAERTNLWTIDIGTNTVTGGPIVLGDNSVVSAQGLALTPDAAFAYVGSISNTNSAVWAVDLTAGSLIATIPFGTGWPRTLAITPDGTSVYVTEQISSSVSVIEVATNTVVNTIPSGGAYGIAISPDGAFAYGGLFGAVSVIDLATDLVVGSIPGVGPNALFIAIAPGG